MSSHFYPFIILILISLLSTTHLVIAGRCCPGDSICSGCWMCPGSDLRNCWDNAIKDVDQCASESNLKQMAQCYCLNYAKVAKCWSVGTCCTEYAPSMAAATNLCNFANWPTEKINNQTLQNLVKEARNVKEAIWHNDSGYDVPKLSIHVDPLGSSNKKFNPSNDENLDNNYQDKNKNKKFLPKKSYHHHHSHKHYHKRNPHFIHPKLSITHSIQKRSSSQCGIDFQGVPYPKSVPTNLLKAYSQI